MSEEAKGKIVGLGKIGVKDLQRGMFEYIVADYEFERNKAIGGVLGGQERADEGALKARDANEAEIGEFKKGVIKINEKAILAEEEYEKAVKGLVEDNPKG